MVILPLMPRLTSSLWRSDWSRLCGKDIASVCVLASQDSSHVGNAGVREVSLRGAPLSMPTFATAGFHRFFNLGVVFRCMLPMGSSWFMHLEGHLDLLSVDDDTGAECCGPYCSVLGSLRSVQRAEIWGALCT